MNPYRWLDALLVFLVVAFVAVASWALSGGLDGQYPGGQ